MQSVLGFLIILGPLVVVHEFGHYLFAKLFGVKAEVFSVGFGPRLWSRKSGETEWRISAIPLGGYVKLFGEEPGVKLSEEDKKRALQYADPWKRFFIFFGGPLFNFIFAAFVFMAILVIGEPQVANVLGRVEKGSHAAQAGLQSGDQVLSVNGKKVTRFHEILMAVNEAGSKPIQFNVIHPGETQSVQVKVTPETQDGFSLYGETKAVGNIPGIYPVPRGLEVGVSDPQSVLGKNGIQTGDQLETLNGVKLQDWEEFEKKLASISAGAPVSLGFQLQNDSKKQIELKKYGSRLTAGKAWGLHSSELFVAETIPDSPASDGDVRAGDRFVSVNGTSLRSFYHLRDLIQAGGEETGKVNLVWEREGKRIQKTLTPSANQVRDPLLRKSTEYTIGIKPMLTLGEPVTIVERVFNPFVLVYKGFGRMFDFTWRNIVTIGKMFAGKVSLNTLGGPILIGKIAGESLSRGLISFLTMMAILSVGLGILNVLPIPVLDGGHILLLGIEVVRRRPLSIRQTEILQQTGLALILLLMIVVMKNDLMRLPIFN